MYLYLNIHICLKPNKCFKDKISGKPQVNNQLPITKKNI